MSKRLCSLHGIWDKLSNSDRCPKCKKLYSKNYDKNHRNKEVTKFYHSANWNKIRKKVLMNEPICRQCTRSISSHIDHIIPIKRGGCKTCLDNLQALCSSCHSYKTSKEDILNRPYWLPTPKIPVLIISGASGSGKSFLANKLSNNRILVIDLDVVRSKILGKDIYCWSELDGLEESLLERNRLLASLSAPNISKEFDSAIFIISAPKKETREWWSRTLKADIILLLISKSLCRDRIDNDERRRDKEEYFKKIIDKWFIAYTKSSIDYIVDGKGGGGKSLQVDTPDTIPTYKLLDKLI
ncbi:MAG: HNH endonuclease [Sulfurovum sp.]